MRELDTIRSLQAAHLQIRCGLRRRRRRNAALNAMDLREQQLAFAAHLRDPERHPAPEGIEDRRREVYREFFLNNVSGLRAGTFPVLHRILGCERWRRLIRCFYAGHRCHTPLFLERYDSLRTECREALARIWMVGSAG